MKPNPKPKDFLLLLLITLPLTSCARLHNVQISDIDNTRGPSKRFVVEGTSQGVNLSEATSLVSEFSRSPLVTNRMSLLSSAWELINYGPRTGDLTFSDGYADALRAQIAMACPARQITSLTYLRETKDFPILSNESVRVLGTCASPSIKAN